MKAVRSCLLLAALVGAKLALAAPFGASSCSGGEAAVGGSHLSASVGTGSPAANAPMLEEGGFVVMIGPNVPPTSPDVTPLELKAQTRYPITLFSEQCSVEDASYECALTVNPFRGFLMRLGRGNKGVDTSGSFEVNLDAGIAHLNSKPLDLCQNESPSVGGITHLNNTIKSQAGAYISLPYADTNVPLDVTVVVRNCRNSSVAPVEACDPSNSTYYFTRYYLEFEGEEQPTSTSSPLFFTSSMGYLTLALVVTTAWLSLVAV